MPLSQNLQSETESGVTPVWVWYCVAIFVLLIVLIILVCFVGKRTNCQSIKIVSPLNQTLNAGVTPAGMASTNKYLYIANNNNYGLSNEDSVSVFSAHPNEFAHKTTIHDASFNQPYTITVAPCQKKAYVTNSNSNSITILNTKTNTVSGVITGFDGPSGMAISPDGNTGWVINYGGPILGSGNGTTVSIVNLETLAVTGTITVGLAPAALTLSNCGKYLYVVLYSDGNSGTGQLVVVNTETNTVVGRLSGFSGPFGLALSPCGKQLAVSNFGSNNFQPYGTTVALVDVSDVDKLVITEQIETGIQPSGVTYSTCGKYIFVTNYATLYSDPIGFNGLTAGQGTVSVISLECNKVLKNISVSQSPANLLLSSCGRFLFVSCYTGGVVNVIAL